MVSLFELETDILLLTVRFWSTCLFTLQ